MFSTAGLFYAGSATALLIFVLLLAWIVLSRRRNVCRSCGAANRPGDHFCVHCGHTLSRPRWPGCILAATLLLNLGILGALFLLSAPRFEEWLPWTAQIALRPAAGDDASEEIPPKEVSTELRSPAILTSIASGEDTVQSATLETLPDIEKTATPTLMPTATATVTPTATATTTPSPTATVEPILVLSPLVLGEAGNGTLDFAAPAGNVNFDDIPFIIGDRVFKSQARPAPHNTAPDSIQIAANLPHPQRLHLLINTGNGFNEFNNEIIGEIIVICQGRQHVAAQLRLGVDVREWHAAANVISSASNSVQVWRGQIGSTGEYGHIDLLSLFVPDACRESTLESVVIRDTSLQSVGSLDPALNLVALTVEHFVFPTENSSVAP